MSLTLLTAIFLANAGDASAQMCASENSIISVKTTRTRNTDSIVFRTMINDPQFKINTVRQPFYSGESDQRINVRGNSHRAIQFSGVMWTCEIDEGGIRVGKHITAVRNTYQFEGDIIYTVGMNRGVKYQGVKTSRRGKLTEIEFIFGK